MTNDHPLDSIPAFVLGVLDSEEARAIAQHIAVCANCHAEAASFRKSIAADSTHPDSQPRSHVKQRLMERISVDTQRPIQRHNRLAQRRLIAVALVGATMLASMLLALFWFREATPTARSHDRLLREREIALIQGHVPADDRLVALLAAPQTMAYDLSPGSPASSAHAALYVQPGDPWVALLVRDLPPAPTGATYQIWVANDDGLVSLGVFAARSDGTTEVLALAPAQIETYTDMMVTVEPHGGAATPSSAIVWQVKL
jgi:anti-sigma-K factor RskA